MILSKALNFGLVLSILTATPAMAQDAPETAPWKAREEQKISIPAKVGRAVGIGSSAVAMTAWRPFMFSASFLRGLFGNAKRQDASLALIDIILKPKNIDALNKISVDAISIEDFATKMKDKLSEIVGEEVNYTFLSLVHEIEPSITVDSDPDKIDWTKVDFKKLTPAIMEKNEAYLNLKRIIGNIDDQKLIDSYTGASDDDVIPDLDEIEKRVVILDVDFKNHFAAAFKDQVPEVFGSFLGETVGVPVALHVFTSLTSFYLLPVSLGFVGTGVSVWQCLKNQDRVADPAGINDKNLQAFCQKAMLRPDYRLVRSRLKGLRSGHKAKMWIKGIFHKRK